MKILIETECNEKTCGKCKLIVRASRGAACGLFVQVLEETKKGYKRLPICMATCKAKE